jgi:hypothetical protein
MKKKFKPGHHPASTGMRPLFPGVKAISRLEKTTNALLSGSKRRQEVATIVSNYREMDVQKRALVVCTCSDLNLLYRLLGMETVATISAYIQNQILELGGQLPTAEQMKQTLQAGSATPTPYHIDFSGVTLNPTLMCCQVKGCRNGAITSVWNYPGIKGRHQFDLCAVHVRELYERTTSYLVPDPLFDPALPSPSARKVADSFTISPPVPGVHPIPVTVRHDPGPGLGKRIPENMREIRARTKYGDDAEIDSTTIDHLVYQVDANHWIRLPKDAVEIQKSYASPSGLHFSVRMSGTMSPQIYEALRVLPFFEEAREKGMPWILDPFKIVIVLKGAKLYDIPSELIKGWPEWWCLTKIHPNLVDCEHKVFSTREQAQEMSAWYGGEVLIRQIPSLSTVLRVTDRCACGFVTVVDGVIAYNGQKGYPETKWTHCEKCGGLVEICQPSAPHSPAPKDGTQLDVVGGPGCKATTEVRS